MCFFYQALEVCFVQWIVLQAFNPKDAGSNLTVIFVGVLMVYWRCCVFIRWCAGGSVFLFVVVLITMYEPRYLNLETTSICLWLRVIGVEFMSGTLNYKFSLVNINLKLYWGSNFEYFQKQVLSFIDGFTKKSNIIGIIQANLKSGLTWTPSKLSIDFCITPSTTKLNSSGQSAHLCLIPKSISNSGVISALTWMQALEQISQSHNIACIITQQYV